MLVGIVTRTLLSWVDEFERACETLCLDYKLIDIDRADWSEQISGVDILLWRIHLGDKGGLEQACIKIPLMEQRGILCFPSSKMASFYENKIKQTFFFQQKGYLHPETLISFSYQDAVDIIERVSYPIVCKTSGGASSSGVFLLNNQLEAHRVTKMIFEQLPLWKNRVFRLLKKAFGINCSIDCFKYIYLQKMVSADNDWRITTMGNGIVSVFKRYNRDNDFRASGSGKWGKVTLTELPIEACDIALKISEEESFSCMAYDFLISNGRNYLVEMSYTFLLNDVYVNTLFQKTENGYVELESIPVGVMHIQSLLTLKKIINE